MGAKKRTKRAKRRTAKRRPAKKRAAKRRPARRKSTKRRTAKRKTAKRRTAKRKPARRKKSRRKPNAAFMRPVTPDATLAAVVGSKPLPRTELTKKLWAYIRRHGLQDKRNRRMINADASLRRVFNGRSQVSMFEMTKLVSRHVR